MKGANNMEDNGIDVRKEVEYVNSIREEEKRLLEDPYKMLLKNRNPSSIEAKRRSDSIDNMLRKITTMAQTLEESGADRNTLDAYFKVYSDLMALYELEINTSLNNMVEEARMPVRRNYYGRTNDEY